MLEKIQNTFNDIRDAIIEKGVDVGECESPTTYAAKILTIAAGTGTKVVFIPVFKSSATKPAKPTGQMSANNPTNYPDGGGTPDGLTGNIGISYTIVGESYVYVPWTEPILISGNSTTNASKMFTVYLELSSLSVTPNVPTGGAGDPSTNKLVGDITSTLSNGDTKNWSTSNTHVNGAYTGLSMATFDSTGTIIGVWSDPICINAARDGKDGVDGRNGTDGDSVEYIYRQCASYAAYQSLEAPESDPDTPDYVPDGGSDSPQGVDGTVYKVEAVCVRKYSAADQTGGAFSNPTIGAMGGSDGIDGDGVEYIFKIAASNEIQEISGKYRLSDTSNPPLTERHFIDGLAAGVDQTVALGIFQKDGFVPGKNPDADSIGGNRGGVGDPIDVDSSNPFQFCSVRKYNGETKTWGYFSEPTLWSKYPYESGSVFTSFAFARSFSTLSSYIPLTGGSISHPLPDDIIIGSERVKGSDAIPDGSATVGMTTRQFGDNVTSSWSTPRILTDSSTFQVEYSSDYNWITKPTLRNLNDYLDATKSSGVDIVRGRNYCSANNLGNGSDGSDDSDDSDNRVNAAYMATCSKINGLWTDGCVVRIKDEELGTKVTTIEGDIANIKRVVAETIIAQDVTTKALHCESEDVDITIEDGWFKATSKQQNNLSQIVIGIDTESGYEGCPILKIYDKDGILRGGYTAHGSVQYQQTAVAPNLYTYPLFSISADPTASAKLNAIRSGSTLSPSTTFYAGPTIAYFYNNLFYAYADHTTLISNGIYKDVATGGSPKLTYTIYNPLRDVPLSDTPFISEYNSFAANFPNLSVQNQDHEYFFTDTSALETAFRNYQLGDPDHPYAITVGADLIVNGSLETFVIYAGTNIDVGNTGSIVPDMFNKVLDCLNITIGKND